MKLQKRYLEFDGTALYYRTQASYRKTAIDLAISALRELPVAPDDPLADMQESLRAWTMDVVFQGAWLREYHHWETDTKAYFDAMHARNGSQVRNWRKMQGSHVEKVLRQIELFKANPPSSLSPIDKVRERINNAKHEGIYLAMSRDYESLHKAVSLFWSDLNRQESVDYK